MNVLQRPQIVRIILLLIVVLFAGLPAHAEYGGGSGMAASAETSKYVFVPDQSELVQTGGIAGIEWTYRIEGHLELTVDPNAGTASFNRVDANATDDSPLRRTLDPNEVFNMTLLVGTVLEDTTISFTGKAGDGSDVLITLTMQDDLAYLVGETVPPPNTADFFVFSLDAVAERRYGGGTGELSDPYQIATAEDLMLLGESPDDYDKHFILTADIDLDPCLPGRKVFDRAVIGAGSETHFTGVFDGNSHTISHLMITRGYSLGLFGRLGSGAEVKDLGVVDVNINGSHDSVGGLVGINDGQVTRCYSTGTVRGQDYVGGLVSVNSGIIIMSYSTGTVRGQDYVGGLVSVNSGRIIMSYSTGTVGTGEDYVGGLVGVNSGIIIMSYSTGTVSGYYATGGLAGGNSGGTVTTCYSTGAVSGSYDIGGLVGLSSGGTVTTCYSTGAVSGYEVSGGLVGSNGGDLTNCYSTGMVSGVERVGGLVGVNAGRMSTSYSTGTVSGTEDVGGLVGRNYGGTVSSCFWDTETSGLLNMCGSQEEGGTGCDDSFGLTTGEMQMASTFLEGGWDLINVWGIGEKQTYPYLRKYSAADINQNETVDFGDLAILAENWLSSGAP